MRPNITILLDYEDSICLTKEYYYLYGLYGFESNTSGYGKTPEDSGLYVYSIKADLDELNQFKSKEKPLEQSKN